MKMINNDKNDKFAKNCNEYEYETRTVAPAVDMEFVEEIIDNSDIIVQTVFDKCTVVSCRLPNGFVIVESSASVSPENYNTDIGTEICMNKIADKIYEFESYMLHEALHQMNVEQGECLDCFNCDGCEECANGCLYENFEDEDDEDFDECLDTDLDCDNCEGCDYYCNPKG